jgi:hypothetical protein
MTFKQLICLLPRHLVLLLLLLGSLLLYIQVCADSYCAEIVDMRKFATSMAPYPRMKFFSVSYANDIEKSFKDEAQLYEAADIANSSFVTSSVHWRGHCPGVRPSQKRKKKNFVVFIKISHKFGC